MLIEITRNVSHLPYRAYKVQADRSAANAHELGEVWIRKGSTKGLATSVEVAALGRQAALYLQATS